MKTENAVKKLEKNGFRVERHENQINAWKGEYRIGFYDQAGEITCIWTDYQYARDTRDPMTDYFPETYHDNITQAINFVGRRLAEKAQTTNLNQGA